MEPNELSLFMSFFLTMAVLPQKMVKSLSSDKAVWDAILNNEAVRELRESFSSG